MVVIIAATSKYLLRATRLNPMDTKLTLINFFFAFCNGARYYGQALYGARATGCQRMATAAESKRLALIIEL